MTTPEKFCLRWTDFENNISGAFQELRNDEDFFDVTLACEDDQIQAHKVILSACSPFFRSILRRNRHEHPLLYLKGVKYTDLVAVLNFMYQGEVNVAQDELNTFLAVSEELKIKGLTQNDAEKKQNHIMRDAPKIHLKEPLKQSNPRTQARPLPEVPRPRAVSSSTQHQHLQPDVQEVVPIKTEPVSLQAEEPYRTHQAEEGIVADPDMEYGETYEDFAENYAGTEAFEGAFTNNGEETKDFQSIISSVLEYDSTDRVWRCTECGKTNTDKARVRRHAEIHFQGFVHSCPHCGCQKKTSTALRYHIHAYHTKKQ